MTDETPRCGATGRDQYTGDAVHCDLPKGHQDTYHRDFIEDARWHR